MNRLEIVFDRAFEPIISDRFASAKELVDRFKHAKSATANEPKKLDDILKSRSTQLISNSRKVQLQEYTQAATRVFSTWQTTLFQSQSSSNIQLTCSLAPAYKELPLQPGLSYLGRGFGVVAKVVGMEESSVIEYAFAAQGTQSVLLRRRMEIVNQNHVTSGNFGGNGFFGNNAFDDQSIYMMQLTGKPLKAASDWDERLWYPGNGKPEDAELMTELSNCVETLIDELEERLR